ncbi:MAG: ABC transporter substrate-binding protein [Acidobacteriota bacterium]
MQAAVTAGRLPPVAERLPQLPMVVQPENRPGRYGGVLKVGILGGGQDNDLIFRVIGYEQLVRWDAHWTRILPNVAYRVEESVPNREWIFHLRGGLRWSDGEPFTARDVVFAVDHVLRRHDSPAPLVTRWRRLEPVAEALDDYRVRITLSRPFSIFLEFLASPAGHILTSYPAHYFAPLLERSEPDRLPYLENQPRDLSYFIIPGAPTLNPWVLGPPAGGGSRVWRAERNPYYWKIDTAGRQLPYLDAVEFHLADDPGKIRRWALAGNATFQPFYVGTPGRFLPGIASTASDPPVPVELPSASSNVCAVCFNVTHRDPVLREVFGSRDFRIAMSLALDRRELIRSVFHEPLEPYQVAPRPSSPFFDDRLAHQWLRYDPGEALRRLEAAGVHRDPRTGRLQLPDGRPLRFTISFAAAPAFGEAWDELVPRIAEYWRALGCDVRYERLSGEEFYSMKGENKHDVAVWGGDGGIDVLLDPRYYLPYDLESNFAIPWARWWNGDRGGPSEPGPPVVQRQWELYGRLLNTAGREERLRLMREILQIAADQFWCMGIALAPPGKALRVRQLQNVPALIPLAWTYPTPAPANLAQFYLEANPGSADEEAMDR